MQQPTTDLAILFTDVVGSTNLWERDPDWMGSVMARHDRLLESSVVMAGGRLIKGLGDGILAVFPTSNDAVSAASDAQRLLWPEPPDGLGLKVRMAIHFGETLEREGDVFGPAVIRCSRLVDAAHGGQILVSDVAARRLRGSRLELVDLGTHHLRDLAEPIHIHQAVVDGLQRGFPSLRTLHAFAHNLPTRLSSFVGRETELREISGALADHRLVTLTGPGGSGKTRVALQVGADSLERFSDGTWFVNLLRVEEAERLAETVAADLGIATGTGNCPTDALAKAFIGSNTLLIVDNCEHVLEATGEMVTALLGATDHLTVLATSREPLRIDGEAVYPIEPLAVPSPKESEASRIKAYPSTRLFVERVAESGAGSRIGEQEKLMGDIVRRVDGLPLAIELAAGRMRYMSLQEISEALGRSIDVLHSVASDDPRHETIRSTIAWSYDLLTPEERLLLQRLTVFHNGWFRSEAVAVCSPFPLSKQSVETLLESLVDRSLVSPRNLESGVTRFRLLEQVRQFAAERLDEADAADLRSRLVDYFVSFFLRHGNSTLRPLPEGESDALLEWMVPMIEDISNLVAAIETAIELQRPVDALRILTEGAWEVFYVQSGYVERYYSWLDRTLEAATSIDPMVALGAIEGAGYCASATTRPERMVELHGEGLRRAIALGAEYVEAAARVGLAVGLIRTGRTDEAARLLDEAVRLAEGRYPRLGLEAELWIALECETGEGGYLRTKRLLAASDELGETVNTSFMRWFFAWNAMDRGELDVALAAVDRVLECPYWDLMAVVQCHLHDLRARILARMGRRQQSEEALALAFEATRRVVGPNWAVTAAWNGATDVATYAGDRDRAETYLRQGLEKARLGDIGLHVGLFGLQLIPYLLDNGSDRAAADLLTEAESALRSVNRLDDFYAPMVELRRCQIAGASGRVGEAAAAMAALLPDDPWDPPSFSLLIEELEVAGLLLASVSDPRAASVFAAIDRWNAEADAVSNPVTIHRRRAWAGQYNAIGGDEAPELAQAVDIARKALRALMSNL